MMEMMIEVFEICKEEFKSFLEWKHNFQLLE